MAGSVRIIARHCEGQMLLQIRSALLASLTLVLAGTAGADPRHLPPAPVGVTYDAVITEHGEIARGNGVVSVERAGNGLYLVSFANDLSACTEVGSFGRATTKGGAYEKPGFLSLDLGEEPNVIRVFTGGLKGGPRERSFHLIIGC